MDRDRLTALNPTRFVLLLHSVPHLGEKTLTRLLRLHAQHRLAPSSCLSLTAAEWQERYEVHPEAAQALATCQEALLAASAEEARLLRAFAVQLLTIESATYPSRLERFDDAPPPVLYALGNLALLTESDREPASRFTFLCAVSNGAGTGAMAMLDEAAARLVEAGGVPVTGHDRTAYKRAALAAQRQNRPICYGFDRGLREALGPEFDRPPFAAARIREAVFVPGRDLALSPFRLDDHSIGANNRRRDRLLFALADIIVAIDVRPGGNMAEQCLRAHRQGKMVYVAAGGREGNDLLRSSGCPTLTDDLLAAPGEHHTAGRGAPP